MAKTTGTTVQATVNVDAARPLGPLRHVWRSIGYDEINWTYTPTGRSIYARLAALGDAPYYVRNHNALTTGNTLSYPAWGSTNVYTEDAAGNPVYDWSIVDRIYDVMTGASCRPIVEFSFMPRDLSAGTDALRAGSLVDLGYFYDDASRYPPKDFNRWGEFIRSFVAHCRERYGLAVRDWRFELWNEPDVDEYWHSDLQTYCRLFDHTVAAVKAVDPGIKVGGPCVTHVPAFLDGFLAHCAGGTNHVTGARGTALDFISCHCKGTIWPKPGVRVQPSQTRILDHLAEYIAVIKKYPTLSGLEVYLDECDIDVGTVMGIYDNPHLIYRNTEYYAAFLCRLSKHLLDMTDQHGINLAVFTTWAYYFEGKRAFEGNRTLFDGSGLEKPVFQALRMLGRMGDVRLPLVSSLSHGSSAEPPVDGLAARGPGGAMTVILWHFDERVDASGDAQITLVVDGIPSDQVAIQHYRIDGEHSNTHSVWRALGSPEFPTAEQVAILRAHEGLELAEPPKRVEVADSSCRVSFRLPMHGLSLLVFEP